MLITKEKEFTVECSCGCSILEIARMDDGEEVYFSLYYSRYYMEQETVIERLTRKLKLIWCVLMNKEYSFYEVILDEKDVPKLKKMIKSL